MFVLGTAGHIDHGKSALVQALTGIDPDRLAEEKERGMTIDLGFAWLKLPGGREIGIVDVPGHERFVRHMLAGSGGIDIAMLVVAANEGVMPQTREHLAILNLLGISRGVVALTKKDLVDGEWLDLVRLEVEELLKDTTLAGAPIIPVSSITREGIPELLATIDRLLENTEPRQDKGRPRLPIDRVFTIVGAGTVVTGTLIDGSLMTGQEVEIVPSGLKSRLRGLQTHRAQVTMAKPGSRVAANLTGVTTAQVQRGDILTKSGWLVPTTFLSARFHILSDARHPLKNNAERHVYILAAEATVRIRLLDAEELKPGESGWVQLILDRAVPVVDGDHFVIRSTTETLGGGVIVDAHARRLPRFNPDTIESLNVREKGSSSDLLLALLDSKRLMEQSEVLAQVSLPPDEAVKAIDDLLAQGLVWRLGQSLLLSVSGWNGVVEEVRRVTQEYHGKFPTRTGIPRVELANRLKLGKHAPMVLEKLVADGVLVDEGMAVRLLEFTVRLTATQQAKVDSFLKALAENPYSPPTELIPEPDLLALLVERKQVVKLSDSVVVSKKTYDDMLGRVLAQLKANGKITLAEVRDMFQTSRKYAQAFLEYLDGEKITRRVGDERLKY
ncbi:MAG: selenocysteine-specific translation elongation factor [Dehalococcoidales bacterium]|nr:selenocysteine-specific translation elongation factor [Dehalococcoidales bacterium]